MTQLAARPVKFTIHGKPRIPKRFRLPKPDDNVLMAHSAVRGAAVMLIRAGQHHDARELLVASAKSALRSWFLAVGFRDVARKTDAIYYARQLRDVHQIDRPTYLAVSYLLRGRFDGTTAWRHLDAVQAIHDAVYWTAEEKGGVA